MNVLRRDQLHAENLAEYRPDTLHLRRACRWLANVTERLETVKDGTPEHQRLIAMYTELVAALEASRTSHAPNSLDEASDDELIRVTTNILKHLLDQQDQQRHSVQFITAAVADNATAIHDTCEAPAAFTSAPVPTSTPAPRVPLLHARAVHRPRARRLSGLALQRP